MKAINIGLIGLGVVSQVRHLPAYKQAGFNVLGASDIREEARAIADKWGVKRFFTDYRELLELDEVDIVDVATPPRTHLEITCAAAEAGKHLLVQKPLATSFEDAKEIVRSAARYGVKLAVNSSYRWIPGYALTKKYLDEGYIGKPFLITAEERTTAKRSGVVEGWRLQMEREMILEKCIHHLDLFRYWVGEEPLGVYAVHTGSPEQACVGETIALITLRFSDGLFASIIDSWMNLGEGEVAENRDECRLEGPKGAMLAKLHSLSIYTEKPPMKGWIEPKIESTWTDNFAWPINHLIKAIEEDTEPPTSGRDNLETLRLVFAAYKSAEEKREVEPEEIQ